MRNGEGIVVALSKLGVSIARLLVAVGAWRRHGMALRDPGSNDGAGLSLILTRMFKVSDTIEVRGCAGVNGGVKARDSGVLGFDRIIAAKCSGA